VTLETDVDAGPVVVRTTYSIPTEREPDFMRAMLRVRESRLRTGATQWGLFRNGERLGEFEEIFVVASWDEHLRQHRERMTATDIAYEDQAKALSDTTPQTWHLLPTDPSNVAPPPYRPRQEVEVTQQTRRGQGAVTAAHHLEVMVAKRIMRPSLGLG